MSTDSPEPGVVRLLVGYDGSPSAAAAIDVAARLLPAAAARIVHVWAPPFAGRELRHRLWQRAASLDELIALIEREGLAEAERLAADGVALAAAAGWRAEPLVERNYGDDGFALAQLADQHQPAAVVVGSRGLSGVRALLGSVSDAVVHYSPAPVLVVPQPLLADERSAITAGPVLVGHDGSGGAEWALATAASLFVGRRIIAVNVGREPLPDDELAGVVAAGAEAVQVDSHRVAQGAHAIADALVASATERDAALIVVGSRGRSARREILLGSAAMAVLHHAPRPVLVVPDAQRFRIT